MQTNSIYLYPNKLDVYAFDPAGTWIEERNRMVYNRNLKVYRGVDNRIDLQVRTGDQKTYNTTGTTLVFNLVSRENSDLILSKDCSVDDNLVGRIYVTLTDAELQGIESGHYQYSIQKETRTSINDNDYRVTSRQPLYLDSQYGALGVLEVNGDMQGNPYDTVTIDKFNKNVDYDVPVSSSNGAVGQFDNPRPNYAQNIPGNRYEETFFSGLIDGQPILNRAGSLHTFQIYLDNYEGDLVLQGSLGEGGKPADGTWTDLKTWNLTAADPNFYWNEIGKYNWFRFKYTPSEDNTGTIDKVLYR